MKEELKQALDLDKGAVGRLISLFENTRASAKGERREAIAALDSHAQSKRAFFVGITGTPGSGKSSLIGRLANELVNKHGDLRVAALAVDPASEISGGAFLGDRTRVKFPVGEGRLFFRSQSSDCVVGGLSPHTFSVCRLLYYLFDCVFIETVGIGQNEVEVRHLADYLYLVMQPLAGDQIQFMKSGIMEAPNAFIVNKYDQEAAQKSYFTLKSSLSMVRPGMDEPAVFRASALSGMGIEEISDDIFARIRPGRPEGMAQKEGYFCRKWVREEYGKKGVKVLENKEKDPGFLLLSYDEKESLFLSLMSGVEST